MYLFFFILPLAGYAQNTANRFWTAASDPVTISSRITENLLSRKEFMLYNSPQLKTFHYAEACAAFGATRIAGMLKDPVTIKRLAKRYEPLLDDVLAQI